nr:MAG TPA: hypothetical protein [Caudoviricetes sp.]
MDNRSRDPHSKGKLTKNRRCDNRARSVYSYNSCFK